MSVREFQKRSLPLGHMLEILRNENEIRNRNDIDRIVSRNSRSNGSCIAWSGKKKIMFQVPCTIDNPTAPCMENDSCQRKFQKKRYWILTVIQSTKDRTLELECRLDFTMLTKGILCLLTLTYSKSTMLILIHTQYWYIFGRHN